MQADATQYLTLAQGDPVMLPFASRQFGPLVVRALVHLFHTSYLHAFVIEGLFSLLCFLAVSTFLYLRRDTPWWLLAGIGGLCFWAEQLNGLMMPDLFYAMLVCGLMLLLARGQLLAAALMMLPLTIARESTLLTLLCFLIAGWRWLRKIDIAAAILATAAGTIIVKLLTRNALPNHENIDPSLYLIAKIPWNLLKNVFGLAMWANLYPACEVPKWRMNLHIGPLHSLGVCGFYIMLPLVGISYAFGIFGLFPLVLLKLGRARIREISRNDILLRFSLLYGGLSFVLAPVLGTAMPRLIGYSWPLFLVAIPLLLEPFRAAFRSASAAALFLVLHLYLSWMLLWTPARGLPIVVLVIYAAGWILLRRAFVLEPARVLI